MEHLLYVLWHDCWKPWLMNVLGTIGWALIGLGAVFVVVTSSIALTVYVEKVLGN